MPKIIRDPVHNIIEIDDNALTIIDTEIYQRMRRIRQLGLNWFVYPSAEHTRFVHSLGVYHLSKKLFNVLKSRNEYTDEIDMNEDEERTIRLSALLHDIGHGPFSHTLETAIKDVGGKFKHEEFTKKIVLEPNEINSKLSAISSDLPKKISDIIDNKYDKPALNMIVSSQFDADRMDYLLRDSHLTGAKYGWFDIEWILENVHLKKIDIPDERKGEFAIAINAKKGLNATEQYLIGRFYMYKHVYSHRVVRGFECILKGIFTRILKEEPDLIGFDALKNLSNDTIELEDFINLDDFRVIEWMRIWHEKSSDDILKNLLERFFKRIPLKAIDVPASEQISLKDKLESIYDDLGENKEFLFYFDNPTLKAYKDYIDLKNLNEEIYVISPEGKVHPLGGLRDDSIICNAFHVLEQEVYRFYITDTVFNELQRRNEE